MIQEILIGIAWGFGLGVVFLITRGIIRSGGILFGSYAKDYADKCHNKYNNTKYK